MLEDVLYEILPVVGVATILSAVFVLLVLRKATGNARIFVLFGFSDLLSGVGLISCGLYGVLQTLEGESGEFVHPSSCAYRAPHLLLFAFSDSLEVLVTLLFCFDRMLQIVMPKGYGPLSSLYLSYKYSTCLLVSASFGLVPSFASAFGANSTAIIVKLCRFEEVVGENFYDVRLFTIEWLPVVVMLWNVLIFFIYLIRQSRQAWSYNWTEEFSETKQMIGLSFLRALSAEVSVRLILINLRMAPNSFELFALRDFLIRSATALLVAVLAPGYYMLISAQFREGLGSTFNAYGRNTERKWMSADDPPTDQKMETTEFGSWYSTTGNVRGEAGVPMEERAEKERSASFYFESPPLSESRRPCPPALGHKSESMKY